MNCRQHNVAAEDLYAKYRDDIEFIMVYTIEAYPTGSACPYTGEETIVPSSSDIWGFPIEQPKTYEERVKQAAMFIQQVGITVPMLVDEVDNPIWCTYGPASNIAYLIDTDGTILEKQPYYIPEEMGAAIQSIL